MQTPLFFVCFIVVAALLLGAALALSMFLLRRTMFFIIRTFRECGAVRMESAKTLDEMGLRPKSMMDCLVNPGLRDYKREAFHILMTYDVVKTTVDDKYYLSEYNLIKKIPDYQPN